MMRFDSRWLALEGQAFPPFQARIERGRVTRYLDFLGRPRGEAEAACEDIALALPTLPFSLEMEAGVVAEMAALLSVDPGRLLHGEQAFTRHGPLRCGDRVTVTSRLQDVTWRPERRVCFFAKESRFLVAGRVVVTSRTVYAIKASEEGA